MKPTSLLSVVCLVLFVSSVSAQSLEDNKANQRFTVKGSCALAKDRSAVPNAVVTLFQVRGINNRISELSKQLSDANGKFLFEGCEKPTLSHLSALGYAITVQVDGYATQSFEIQAFDRDFFANLTSTQGLVLFLHSPGVVKGRVVDEQNKPVRGATVQQTRSYPYSHDSSDRNFVRRKEMDLSSRDLGLPFAETDAEGFFALENVPISEGPDGATYEGILRVTHSDYPAKFFFGSEIRKSATMILESGCSINGIVVKGDAKEPFAGATVTAIPSTQTWCRQEFHALTNTEGRFQMVVPHGGYESGYHLILEEDHEYVAEAMDFQCRKGETLDVGSIQAVRGTWITGRIIHSETGKPIQFANEGESQQEPVWIGLHGPSRPKGYWLTQSPLAQVDDQGRFRLRVFPGENYPYPCNLSDRWNGRDTWQKQPVMANEGKEVDCEIKIFVPKTPKQAIAESKALIESLPKNVNDRVVAIIVELRGFDLSADKTENFWRLMMELIVVGKPAVFAICRELETTSDERMVRVLAFALRAIGDPRAVPSLIRVLPKTLLPGLHDFQHLSVVDTELASFLNSHCIEANLERGNGFSLCQPILEIHAALVSITARQARAEPLLRIIHYGDLRADTRQVQLYHQTASDWSQWWEANSEKFNVDPIYRQVNLPRYQPPNLSDFPVGLDLTAKARLAMSSHVSELSVIGAKGNKGPYGMERRFFFDLDTSHFVNGWPKELTREDGLPETVEAAREWASKQEADLMCVERANEDGTISCTLVGIGLELWELSQYYDYSTLELFVNSGKLPPGRKVNGDHLLHLDSDSGRELPQRNTSFLYVTRDQGLGLISIRGFVSKAQIDSGAPASEGQTSNSQIQFENTIIAR